MPKTREMMSIGPGWRPTDVISWSVLVSVFVAAAFIWPGQAVAMLMGPLLTGVIAWVRLRSIRLEITESVVRAKQGRRRGQPDKQVPRSRIRAIHHFPQLISFRGPDNKVIMMIEPNYTVRQLLKVADELKVPLYDHTRWFGMRRMRLGRLAYDPAPGRKDRTH